MEIGNWKLEIGKWKVGEVGKVESENSEVEKTA